MRVTKPLIIREFTSPDYTKSRPAMQDGQLFEAANVALDRGVICAGPTSVVVSEFDPLVGSRKIPQLIRPVKVSDDVKSEFSGSFDGMYAYLVVGDTYEVYLLNPEDFSDKLTITPIMQQANSWTADTELQNYCLVTGWKRNSLTNASGQDTLYIRKGSSESVFQFSTDGSTWSSQYDVTTTGTAISITVNGVTTDLTVYFYTTSLSDLGATDYFTWKSIGTGSYARFTADQEKTIYFWNRKNSYTMFGDQLVFSWFNAIFYYDELGGLATVGYELTYGVQVQNYFNHLVIGQYAPAKTAGNFLYNDPVLLYQVGWSDLNQIHDFYPTSSNEADVFLLEQKGSMAGPNAGVTGLMSYNDKVFIMTQVDCYEMTYIGLPLVMQIRPVSINFTCGYTNGCVATDFGMISVNSKGLVMVSDGLDSRELEPGTRFYYNDLLNAASSTDFVSTYAIRRFPVTFQLYYAEAEQRLVVRAYNTDGDYYNGEYFYDFNNTSWFTGYLNLGNLPVNTPYTAIAAQDNGFCPVIENNGYYLTLRQNALYLLGPDRGRADLDNLPFEANTSGSIQATYSFGLFLADHDIKELHDISLRLDCEQNAVSSISVSVYGYNGLDFTKMQQLQTETVIYNDDSNLPEMLSFNNIRVAGDWFQINVSVTFTKFFRIPSMCVYYTGDDTDVEK